MTKRNSALAAGVAAAVVSAPAPAVDPLVITRFPEHHPTYIDRVWLHICTCDYFPLGIVHCETPGGKYLRTIDVKQALEAAREVARQGVAIDYFRYLDDRVPVFDMCKGFSDNFKGYGLK